MTHGTLMRTEFSQKMGADLRAQKKARQQWDEDKPKIQAARQKKENIDSPPEKFEEFDAILRTQERWWGFQWCQQCHA